MILGYVLMLNQDPSKIEIRIWNIKLLITFVINGDPVAAIISISNYSLIIIIIILKKNQ